MITLRLDPDLEKAIESSARSAGLSKSELVRRGMSEFLGKRRRENPWENGKDLFGKYSSGRKDLSSRAESILRRKLKEKSR